MFQLIVKSPWTQTQGNTDLIDLAAFTRALLKRKSGTKATPISFAIVSVGLKGKMRDRYIQHILGFASMADLGAAVELFHKQPKLKPYTDYCYNVKLDD